MLLAIDIGNTNIVLGLYQGKKLITHWRLATQAERTADEYGVILTQLVEHGGFRCEQISAIAVSCVVPPMLTTASAAARSSKLSAHDTTRHVAVALACNFAPSSGESGPRS